MGTVWQSDRGGRGAGFGSGYHALFFSDTPAHTRTQNLGSKSFGRGHNEMKKSKLDNPHIKQEVVKRLAVGENKAAIARDFGVHRSQVSRFAKREDIRPFIEHEQMKLVEVVPDAVENVKELVREMKDIPKRDTKRRELSYRASMDTLKAVGIMPSPVQSQVITTIYNDQRNQIIAPAVWELINKLSALPSEPFREVPQPKSEIEDED